MPDLSYISHDELLHDLKESWADYCLAQLALKLGITDYSSGSVSSRVDVNLQLIAVIEAELIQRAGPLPRLHTG